MRNAVAMLVALIICVIPAGGGIAQAAQPEGAVVRSTEDSQSGRGNVKLSEDGDVTANVTTPGTPASTDAEPTSSYKYVPPPECGDKAIDKLWNAADDEAKYQDAADELPGGCESPYGVWDSAQKCFVALQVPPQPRSHPVWEGNEDGIVLECTGPNRDCTPSRTTCVIVSQYWSPTAPPGVPDPAALARSAVDSMQLQPIQIGLEPSKGPGLVGMPSWYWAENPRDNEFGEKTATASAGGITVTAQATTQKITWDLNGEAILECDAGTSYKPEYGNIDSECSHRYETQGDKHITATSTWDITWESGDLGYEGASELTLNDTAEADIVIGELQVLNR